MILEILAHIPFVDVIISTVKKVILTIIIAIALFIGYPYYMTSTTDVTVVKTERVIQKNDNYYLIFTDKGVFRNEDSYRLMKFNSSDIYGELTEGKKVTLYHYGFRVHLFNWYPNIRKYKAL